MGISNLSFSATNINVGLDADKSATPRAGDMYLATDTEFLYKCYVDDSWLSDELTEVKIDAAKPNICMIASDSYTGDGTVNKAIAHGLGQTPKYIVIFNSDGQWTYSILLSGVISGRLNVTSAYNLSVTAHDNTNFYVGNATDYAGSANYNEEVYYWKGFI